MAQVVHAQYHRSNLSVLTFFPASIADCSLTGGRDFGPFSLATLYPDHETLFKKVKVAPKVTEEQVLNAIDDYARLWGRLGTLDLDAHALKAWGLMMMWKPTAAKQQLPKWVLCRIPCELSPEQRPFQWACSAASPIYYFDLADADTTEKDVRPLLFFQFAPLTVRQFFNTTIFAYADAPKRFEPVVLGYLKATGIVQMVSAARKRELRQVMGPAGRADVELTAQLACVAPYMREAIFTESERDNFLLLEPDFVPRLQVEVFDSMQVEVLSGFSLCHVSSLTLFGRANKDTAWTAQRAPLGQRVRWCRPCRSGSRCSRQGGSQRACV